MARPNYYFEISRSGGVYYAQTSLPGAESTAATNLGMDPEEAANAILTRLQTVQIQDIGIYTKLFSVRLSGGRQLTRNPIEKDNLERIVRLVHEEKPLLTIVNEHGKPFQF